MSAQSKPRRDDSVSQPIHCPIPTPRRNAMFRNYASAKAGDARRGPLPAIGIGVVVFHMGLSSGVDLVDLVDIDHSTSRELRIDPRDRRLSAAAAAAPAALGWREAARPAISCSPENEGG